MPLAGSNMHRPRKRFGQHFLVDESVIAAIVAAVAPKPGEVVVEIGPGLGAITRPLLQQGGALIAIELDRDLAARLRRTPGLEVIEADVLRVDFGALAAAHGTARLRIVGNLPYNISTPILFHLLNSIEVVADQHVMLQREVAERIAAAPGGKSYGRLSVMLQWRYAIETVLEVPAQAFEPPPKVESAVVRMRPLAPAAGVDAALLGELVSIAFSQRRKLLRHTLGRWLEARASNVDFDVQRRAEEVPVDEYLRLAASL
ncbi:MAG: 16S rRNA (adenine(1518)-N(6)/adenine(1519)-N(6))-dimethyltransferase RsmA [Pseudomonadota bacterium]|nr:16S rRNA (adenine(1518)-N(6)/adenine(1519)-N(6))-dimethyltransferase RsmA [Pseudomonadota bacterium]